MAGKRKSERRLAASVGTHESMHTPGFNRKVDTLQDWNARGAHTQVSYLKSPIAHGFHGRQPFRESQGKPGLSGYFVLASLQICTPTASFRRPAVVSSPN